MNHADPTEAFMQHLRDDTYPGTVDGLARALRDLVPGVDGAQFTVGPLGHCTVWLHLARPWWVRLTCGLYGRRARRRAARVLYRYGAAYVHFTIREARP